MATEWRTAKLSELVAFKTGKLDSNAAVPDGDYPFFTCSQETLRTNTYSFDTECVLLAGNNANGIYPLKYFHGKFDAYQRTYVVKPRDPDILTTKFLYYSLRPKLSELRSFSTGAATKFLTLTILNETEIEVPPLPVQQRIAGILSAYDELMENSQRRIRILEAMARALYREWFVHFRFPGHEKLPRVASPLGDIPQGWEVATYGDLYNTRSGGTPSRQRADYFEDGSVDWVKSQELLDGFILSSEERITEEALENSSAKVFPANTVLVALYGATIGMLGILAREAATNQACCAVLPKRSAFGREFAFLTLLLNRERIIGLRLGAAQQNISQVLLRNFECVKPSDEFVSQFSERAAPLFDGVLTLQRQIQNLRRTRDLLLPRLLSGQSVPPAP
jgi:type I restriction enzyme, S subunit